MRLSCETIMAGGLGIMYQLMGSRTYVLLHGQNNGETSASPPLFLDELFSFVQLGSLSS